MILGKKSILLLVLIALIGMTSANVDDKEEQLEQNDSAYGNPTTSDEKSLKFSFEQSVSGTGFSNAYKYTQMPDALGTQGRLFNGVESKNKAHGSGKLDTYSTIRAESSYSNKTWINGAIDEDGEEIEDEEETISQIQVKEESNMTYSPLVMSIGSRYYGQHQIVFNSLLLEEDWMKNRDGLNSINHLVYQAHGLNKKLEAQLDPEINSMKIEEDLIDGQAHFGVLQLEGIPVDEEPEEDSEEEEEEPVLGLAMKTWKKPLILIDEDYVGSYHIEKNMSLYTASDEEEEELDSWLPCCSGGFSDMSYPDAETFKSASGIFDCSCFRVQEKAQFP
ncbi:MAG: hypothetical protein MUE87_00780 [Methanothrix sp.]|nr:hypothetical protein [Methanothrix sp.]